MAYGAGDRGSGARAPRKRKTPVAPVPQTQLGALPRLQSYPGHDQEVVARKRVARAQPAPVLPHVPIIRNPTPAQTVAAKKAISSAITRHVGTHGTGEEKLARRAAVVHQLQADPRAARFVRAMSHYARADERQLAAQLGRAAGAQGRSAQIRTGRKVIAYHQQRDQVHPKLAPKVVTLGPASLPIGAAAKTVQRAVIGATSLNSGDIGPRTFVGRVGSDAKTLAEGPFIGGYTVAQAAVEGLKKHPLLALGTLPGALVAAATTKRGQDLGKGVVQQYAHEIRHPIQSFSEHPLLTALDAAGAVGAVGRVAGAGARVAGSTAEAGGLRGSLARAGSTVRPPLALGADEHVGVVQRTYSKDLIRKAGQVASDSAREPLTRPDGSVVTTTDRGRTVPVLKAHPHEVERLQKKQADFEVSRANASERLARDQASNEATVTRREVGSVRQRTRDVVAMVTEGTITSAKHFEEDLRAHRDRLQDQLDNHPEVYRHTGERKAAEARVALADSVLKSPKDLARAERIVAAGEKHGARLNAGDVAQAEAKLAAPDELRRAALKVTAVEHMGAKHFTVEEHARLERDALKVEQAARERAAATAPGTPERVAARADLAAARANRIAVSGREASGVHAHEAAVARARMARVAHQRVQASIARLEKSRARLVGSQASRRGRRQAEAVKAGLKSETGERPAGKATLAEQRKLAKIDRMIKFAREHEKQVRSTRTIAEHRVRETPMPAAGEGLRTAEGKHLPTEEIEKFLQSRGRDPETVAYLPGETSRTSFHRQFRPGSRGSISGQVRTGSQHLKGSSDASAELLREQGVRQAVQINKARAIDTLVQDHGLRHPAWSKAQRGEPLTAAERRIVARGGLFNAREAAEAIQRLEKDEGQLYVAMTAYPSKLDAETARIIREDMQGPGGMDSLSHRLLNDRLVSLEDAMSSRARNIVLQPAALIDRMEKHLAPAGPVERGFQFLNQAFRLAVLPQPRWLFGNFVEPYIVRLTASGAGLNVFGMAADLHAAAKGLKTMESSNDPKVRAAAQAIRAQQYGGLFIGGRGATVRRSLEELGPLKYAAIVRDLPVVRQTVDLARHLPQAFFKANRYVEMGAQRPAFGKSVREDIHSITGSWLATLRLQQDALAELQKGLTNTPTQLRFMKAQRALLGQYEGFSPGVRRLTQTIMPFVPWTMNAARFTMWTMPAHHTVLTSLLVKTNNVVADAWAQQHNDVPPGGLKLAIPNGKGGWLDLSRYTPYGLSGPVAEGDLGGVTGQFAPQLEGARAALEGRDPFGRALKVEPTASNPQGKPSLLDKILIGLQTTGEATVPLAATARRLREGGGTGYANSTIVSPKTKPGSKHGGAVDRVFDPLHATYLKPKAGPVSTAPLPQSGPVSPQDRILLRAAERQAQGGLSDRQMQLLERAATRGR